MHLHPLAFQHFSRVSPYFALWNLPAQQLYFLWFPLVAKIRAHLNFNEETGSNACNHVFVYSCKVVDFGLQIKQKNNQNLTRPLEIAAISTLYNWKLWLYNWKKNPITKTFLLRIIKVRILLIFEQHCLYLSKSNLILSLT